MTSIAVPLSQGKIAIVDAEDAERVLAFKWSATYSHGFWYARRSIRAGHGKQRHLQLHRFLLDAPPDACVDHINGNGLDNRRSNLRLATPAQNAANKRPRASQSGYKGVLAVGDRWSATIAHRYLGLFSTAEVAARAYDTAARDIFGEFACLNFPDEEIAVDSRVGGVRSTNTSGFCGVSYSTAERKWTARITADGKRIFLGYHADAETAARAVDAKARELFGDAAHLNFP